MRQAKNSTFFSSSKLDPESEGFSPDLAFIDYSEYLSLNAGSLGKYFK